MNKFLVALIAFALGVAATVGVMRLATGPMVGAGVGIGLAQGMCMVVQAGKSSGVLTDDQIGTILTRATEEFGGAVPAGTDMTTAAADCEAAMAKLKAGG